MSPMQPGHRIGAYALVEELGAGGMGVVWRAHDSRLGRDVALKILPPHLAEHPTALVRFEREARGLASLSHPGIVSIFDLGEEGNLRYLVTELLSGEALRGALRKGPLPWRRAAEIGATIAEALAAAHAKGIIHRDLKPENVFLTSEGRVKILDFGLAKELAMWSGDATTQEHHTEPGTVMGTLGYVSPEQLRGQEADLASNVFSLGCILYEMLSGRPAFVRASAADTIAAILTTEPPPQARPPTSRSSSCASCTTAWPRIAARAFHRQASLPLRCGPCRRRQPPARRRLHARLALRSPPLPRCSPAPERCSSRNAAPLPLRLQPRGRCRWPCCRSPHRRISCTPAKASPTPSFAGWPASTA